MNVAMYGNFVPFSRIYDNFVPFSRVRGLDIGISARTEGDCLPETFPYLNIAIRRAVYRC